MNPWAAFVLGLLVGWLIEWVIDWVYWRRRKEGAAKSIDTQNQIDRLESDVTDLRVENLRLENLLNERDALLRQRTIQPVEAQAAPPPRDDLTRIAGIDTNLRDRLYSAGIITFTDLGALRPAQLRETLGEPALHTDAAVEIVKQARILSGSLKQVDDLVDIQGIGPVIARILYQAGIFSFADVGNLTTDELREIVGERIERLADEEKILAHARQLAGME